MGSVWYGYSCAPLGLTLTELAGSGIINTDGEMWKTQRKAGMSFLNTANLRVLTEVALPQHLRESIDYLRSASGVVDLQHVFHEITTQLMGKMAYNVRPMQWYRGMILTLCRWRCMPTTSSRSRLTMHRVQRQSASRIPCGP
jgi:cytochrome P450